MGSVCHSYYQQVKKGREEGGQREGRGGGEGGRR